MTRSRSRGVEKKGADKLEDLATTRGVVGAPLLTGATAVLQCVTEARHDADDHVILVGRERQPLVLLSGRTRQLPD